MKKFVYLYFGGNPPATAEAGKAIMADWMSYFQKMGDKIVDGGAPLGPHKSVGGKSTANPSGYSIVNSELDHRLFDPAAVTADTRAFMERFDVAMRGVPTALNITQGTSRWTKA